MNAEKILGEWKRNIFKPVYWLEGEEDYFIDQVMQFAEDNILSETEKEFNLTVFYGKDANWTDIVNACRRYPMFSERQVVLLKEAQHMRDIEKLEAYLENPLASTLFVVSFKEKKIDGRTKFAKLLKEKAEVLNSKKLYENQLPDWTNELVQAKGYTISQKALVLLLDHIGNDLTRIDKELDKILVNVNERRNISEDEIEKFVGISKEYNVFELQEALARKDLPKAYRIIQYFDANPKAAPIQMVLPTLYNFFSKVNMIYSIQNPEEKTVASAIGVHSFFIRDYLQAARNYTARGTEQIILLLHEYNLRSLGIHDAGTSDASLMKELVVKMMC